MTSQLFCALFFSVAFSTDSVIGLKAFSHECNVVNSGLVVTWSFKKFFCWKKIKKEEGKDSTVFGRIRITPHINHNECSEQRGGKMGCDYRPGAQVSIFNRA